MREVHLRLLDGSGGLRHRGHRALERRHCSVVVRLRGLEVGLGQQLLRGELLGALVLLLRVRHRRFRLLDVGASGDEVGAGLAEPGVESRGLQAGDDLVLLHAGVEVRAQAVDGAGHLRTHLDGGDGLQGPGGAHHVHDVAAVHRGRLVLDLLVTAPEGEQGRRRGHDQGERNPGASRVEAHTRV